MNKHLLISVKVPRSALVRKTITIFSRTIKERCGLETRMTRSPEADLVMAIDPTMAPESYRLSTGPQGALLVTGGDERGLLYGVGRCLHDATFTPKNFSPGAWRGISCPSTTLRGIYFATHFHNYYHDAPLADIARYVEDLALWGCNTLSVWFDMHHYTGMQEPAARRMIVRLKAILKAAQAVGIRPGLIMLANEGYASTPRPLRADWTAGHDGYHAEPMGHYHVEVCPSSKEGLDLILRTRREVLQALAGVDLKFIVIWPYDQGGCTCARCTPWGGNGYLKIAAPVAKMTRALFPNAKVILSTWYFDRFVDGEWAAFDKAITQLKPDWLEYILADSHNENYPDYPLKHGVPCGLPLVSFPEISMQGMWPWGGFGANPMPLQLQHIWNKAGTFIQGGFPYSEGIFEDLNKVIMLNFFWNRDAKAVDAVRSYVHSHFGPKAVDSIVQAVLLLEKQHTTHEFRVTANDMCGNFWEVVQKIGQIKNPRLSVKYRLTSDKLGSSAWNLLRKAALKLTPAVRKSWRWRLLSIRAELDHEIKRSKGQPTARTQTLFKELIALYCAERAQSHPQDAEWLVIPPEVATVKAMLLKKRLQA